MTNKLKRFILKHGKHYTPSLTDNVIRGHVGKCYDTCVLNILSQNRLKYVEGIALKPDTGEWVLHAWLTDPYQFGGEYLSAYDPTWRKIRDGKDYVVPTDYIGFQIDRKEVIDFMKETEYSGIIANAFRSPKRARRMIPGLPISFWKRIFK